MPGGEHDCTLDTMYSKQCQCTAAVAGTSHLVPAVQGRLSSGQALVTVSADNVNSPQVPRFHPGHCITRPLLTTASEAAVCRNLGHAVIIGDGDIVLLVSMNQTFVRRLNIPVYRKAVSSFVAKVISVFAKKLQKLT